MPFIIIITIAIYIISILWTWKSLGYLEKNKKVVLISIGTIAIYFVTWIAFSISKQGVNYENIEMAESVGKIIVSVFSGMNNLLVMPYLGRLFDKMNEDEIESKVFSKRIMIILAILFVVLWLECGYMRDTQEGILHVYNAMK